MEEITELERPKSKDPLPKGLSCKLSFAPGITKGNLLIEVEYGADLPKEWKKLILKKISQSNFSFNDDEAVMFERLVTSSSSLELIERPIEVGTFLERYFIKVKFLGPPNKEKKKGEKNELKKETTKKPVKKQRRKKNSQSEIKSSKHIKHNATNLSFMQSKRAKVSIEKLVQYFNHPQADPNGLKQSTSPRKISDENGQKQLKLEIQNKLKSECMTFKPRSLTQFFIYHQYPNTYFTKHSEAKFKGGNFDEIVFTDWDLSWTNLTRTTFIRTSLKNTNLKNTRLDGVDFTHAKHLEAKQLSEANYSKLIARSRSVKAVVESANKIKEDNNRKQIDDLKQCVQMLIKYGSASKFIKDAPIIELNKFKEILTPDLKDSITETINTSRRKK